MKTIAQPAQPGGPYPENLRDSHVETIEIDGAGPLFGFPPLGKPLADPWALDKQGGADFVLTTVASLIRTISESIGVRS